MKCLECKIELEVKTNQRYRYVESGLNNVYLTGVKIFHCPKCNTETPELPNIKTLHLCIALEIIENHRKLTGEEIKYLRKNLGMKSKALAAKLGYEPEVFSKYENNKSPIGDHGDRSLRLWFLVQNSKEIEKYTSLLEAVDNFDKIGIGTIWRTDIEIPVSSCFVDRKERIQPGSEILH
jgi:putative zinc finger/helix-turn-helix YgiT family protein